MNKFSFTFQIQGICRRSGLAISKWYTVNVETLGDKKVAKRTAVKEAKYHSEIYYPGTTAKLITAN
jgi:hypothetical protein